MLSEEQRTSSQLWSTLGCCSFIESLMLTSFCLEIYARKILYFFAYKTEFFSFLNKPKNLDPSYKKDLDLWDCLGRVKLLLQQNFIGLI